MKPETIYVALLRGVNVGGNGIISMAALKASLEKAGFRNVSTYINSGNALFSSAEKDPRRLEKKIEAILTKGHKLSSKVIIRSFAEIQKLVKSLPKDWDGNKEWRRNVMFLSHSADSKKILKDLRPKEGLETLIYVPGALLWSVLIKDLSRSNMIKLSRQPLYQEMTVRNPNTVRKLYELMKGMA